MVRISCVIISGGMAQLVLSPSHIFSTQTDTRQSGWKRYERGIM